MCGIAGIVKFKTPVTDQEIQLIKRSIYHRGPDSQNHLLENNICLISTRLSIQDLSSIANMPLDSLRKEASIVYNGEVYNFQDIRSELKKKGYCFKTNSDTEVVLNAYLEYGLDCFNRFNGMFGLCIYDRRKQELIIARDRFGKKNVYYTFLNDEFQFSSELKTFTLLRPGNWQINEVSVLQHLAFDKSEQPLLKDVDMVAPGSYVVFKIEEKRICKQSYFRTVDLIDKEYSAELRSLSYQEIQSEFQNKLRTAVELRLISDAPVAVMCSGGVDSSLVTILAKQINPGIEGYLIDIPGHKQYSERRYAEEVSTRFDLHLNTFELDRQKYFEKIIDTVYHNDMPDAHLGSSIGVYYLSRQARERGIKVILSGEGADECFGGYSHRYRRYLVAKKFRHLIQSVVPKAAQKFIFDYNNIILTNNLKDISCTDFLFLALRKSKSLENYKEITGRYKEIGMPHPEIAGMMLWDLTTYITSILVRNDRATMQASIESRTPFLDPEVVKFAMNMPLKYKVNFWKDKRVVKDTLSHYMGSAFSYRKKIGFGVPNYIMDTNYKALLKDGFVVNYLGEDVFNFEKDGMLFRKLIQLEIWYKLFIESRSKEAVGQLLFQQ